MTQFHLCLFPKTKTINFFSPSSPKPLRISSTGGNPVSSATHSSDFLINTREVVFNVTTGLQYCHVNKSVDVTKSFLYMRTACIELKCLHILPEKITVIRRETTGKGPLIRHEIIK